jgi:hypothetical protein
MNMQEPTSHSMDRKPPVAESHVDHPSSHNTKQTWFDHIGRRSIQKTPSAGDVVKVIIFGIAPRQAMVRSNGFGRSIEREQTNMSLSMAPMATLTTTNPKSLYPTNAHRHHRIDTITTATSHH